MSDEQRIRLYYAETINPRKCCAVARYLEAPIEFVRLDLRQRETRTPQFQALNPNGKVPLLEEEGRRLWESNAIMCRLSDLVGADLWPHDDRQIEVLRWLFWDAEHFSRYAGRLYFEHVVKPKISNVEYPDPRAVQEALGLLRTYAAILDEHLRGRSYLLGDILTVADFAIGVTLPYADVARIPLGEFPAIARWHERLNKLPAWREPFPSVH
jgi:glutathione S-transferase